MPNMKGIGRVVMEICSGHGVTDTHTHRQTDRHTAIIELPAAAKNEIEIFVFVFDKTYLTPALIGRDQLLFMNDQEPQLAFRGFFPIDIDTDIAIYCEFSRCYLGNNLELQVQTRSV